MNKDDEQIERRKVSKFNFMDIIKEDDDESYKPREEGYEDDIMDFENLTPGNLP